MQFHEKVLFVNLTLFEALNAHSGAAMSPIQVLDCRPATILFAFSLPPSPDATLQR